MPLLFFVFLVDRFMLLPGRMKGSWEYVKGTYIDDSIAFEDIDIFNNFEITIRNGSKRDSFYLLGCYFGKLYLLNESTMEYTEYNKREVWY